MKQWFNKNKKNLVIFIIYSSITLGIIIYHENWRDEAQAWLIARDLNFNGIVSQMKYEGHFLLWYLILMPFAKLGFPYITTNIISWVITCTSAWIILARAPFKMYKKVMFLFTAPMIYFLPVISRCYCIIPLAVTLIAVFYKDRKQKPIRYILAIALLANTHVIMLAMVGILLTDFYIEQFKNRKENTKEENRKIIYSFLVITLLLVISAIPLWGCLTANKDIIINKKDKSISINSITKKIIPQLISTLFINFETFMNNSVIAVPIAILVIVFIALYAINYKKDFFIVTIIFLWQCIIAETLFYNSKQRVATLILILFFFWWIKENKKVRKFDKTLMKISLTILAIVNILNGLTHVYYEIIYNYSNAYQVGKFINDNVNEKSIIIAGAKESLSTAVIPYITKDIKFYYIQKNRFFTFSTWDNSNDKMISNNMIEEVKNRYKNDSELYYIYYIDDESNIVDKDIINNLEETKQIIKIFETEDYQMTDEKYILYKIYT